MINSSRRDTSSIPEIKVMPTTGACTTAGFQSHHSWLNFKTEFMKDNTYKYLSIPFKYC